MVLRLLSLQKAIPCHVHSCAAVQMFFAGRELKRCTGTKKPGGCFLFVDLSARFVLSQASSLSDHYQCMGVDLEGQGDTSVEPDSTTNLVQRMAEDLLAVVDHFSRDGAFPIHLWPLCTFVTALCM